MKFHVLTLFPEMIQSGCNSSILKRAIDNQLIEVNAVNIRDYTQDKHGKVDDYTYGGGAGMLMQAQPVFDAWESLQRKDAGGMIRTVYVTPQGIPFTQKMVREFAREEELIFLCGHYEGIDERVLDEIVTDRVSIGDYVLTGGELPALVMIDAVSRLVPGVLGSEESAETESFHKDLLEYPQFSRPREWHGKSVPEELLSGDRKKIEEWRTIEAEKRTRQYRPDLYEKYREKQEILQSLLKQKKENAYLIDCLMRGQADILFAEGACVIALHPLTGVAMICCDTAEEAKRLIGYLPPECDKILHNCEALGGMLADLGYITDAECYQSVYTQHTLLPIEHKDIRPYPEQEWKYAAEHYGTGESAEYIRDRISKGEFFAAYEGDRLAGFSGIHEGGSLGLLYVAPEYRRTKIGSSLASFLVNQAILRGGLPYAHIRTENMASLKMQEKMGLYVGKKRIYWMHRDISWEQKNF